MEILLVKRAQEPGIGLWCLPGGFIEREETLEIAAVRELKHADSMNVRAYELEQQFLKRRDFGLSTNARRELLEIMAGDKFLMTRQMEYLAKDYC